MGGSALIGFLLKSDSEVRPEICQGTTVCFRGKVTAITDGDTIKVEGNAIRLALISAPDLHESGGINAREFTIQFCPVGSIVIVDEDDGKGKVALGELSLQYIVMICC